MHPASRVLLVDIETFPLLGYVWQTWDASVLKIVEPTSICAFSAKWLNGKQITKALSDYKGYKPGSRDDKALLLDLWKLLDEADAVVAHNLDKFDAKKINARFTYHRIPPPSPYKQIDTLKEARKIAAYDSNRLNDIGKLHSLGQKVRTGGADLWFDCLAGDMSAWRHMKKYNAQDVVLLESVYLMLRPWMKSHPNLAVGYGPGVCSKCGGTRITRQGFKMLKTTAYQQYKCQECGSWLRDTQNLIEPEDKPYVAA